jgi:pyruvyltransferase
LTRLGGVDVLSWNPLRTTEDEPGGRLVNNFGDLLGPLLVERILGDVSMKASSTASSEAPILVTIGSVLHFAPQGAVVWGTGVNFKLASKLPPHFETLDFRSVRGPYSARLITAKGGRVPAAFGDPALLLPRFMPELRSWSRTGAGGMLIAPNLNDFEAMSQTASSLGHAVLDPRAPLHGVLRMIAESGFVVGSSLHAIAIADSLGIPARFVASAAEGSFKYRDYLAGTGRPLTRISADVEDAIEVGGHAPPDVDLDAVLSAFPSDLWGSGSSAKRPPIFDDRDSILGAWADSDVASGPDEAVSRHHFVQEVFPRAVAAGRALIEDDDAANRAASRVAFDEDFAEAHAYRLALVPGLAHTDLNVADGRLLATLDAGDPDRFLRALWLEREGPHALMRAVRSAEGLHVLSIALRVGTPTNDVSNIEVICRDKTGNQSIAELPVFAMYHRQWSIDLSASVDMGTEVEIDAVIVHVTHADGSSSRIPVTQGVQESSTLMGYPSLTHSPQWREGTIETSLQDGTLTA